MGRFTSQMGNIANRGKQQASRVVNSKAYQKLPGPVQRHPYRSAAAGMMVAGGIAAGGPRRSGLNKVQGRPTGMYGH
jgi:hypothetical protein